MKWWKIFRSNVSGSKPTVNNLDLDAIGINQVDGTLFIKKRSIAGVETIVEFNGSSGGGVDGLTPFIGTNGNWWLGSTDTGVLASGQDGTTPHIGENGNWWIGTVDTDVFAGGAVTLWKRTSGVIEPADGSNGLKINKTGVALELGGRAKGKDAEEDDEFVTLEQLNGSPSITNIVIPELQLKGYNIKNMIDSDWSQPYPRRDTLQAKWVSKDLRFLDYNPEIWLFTRNPRTKIVRSNWVVHPTELLPEGDFLSPKLWTIYYPETGTAINNGALHFLWSDIYDHYPSADINTVLEYGARYDISYEVFDYVSGKVHVNIGAWNPQSLSAMSNGFYKANVLTRFEPEDPRKIKLSLHGFSSHGLGCNLKVRNISIKKTTGNVMCTLHKKWKHHSHMNGIKFPNSMFYSGETVSYITEIKQFGRHTEWELISESGEYQNVDFNPYEFLRRGDDKGNVVTDDFDFMNMYPTFTNSKRNMGMRYAIVIDNPDPLSDDPKLIGPLSEFINMRIITVEDHYARIYRFAYTFEQTRKRSFNH